MKIVELESFIVAVARTRSLATSYGEAPDTVTVMVRVTTDEGVTGVGQTVAPAPFYGETAEAIKAGIDHYLRPALLGRDPFAIEARVGDMERALRGGNYAITAVDFALWDIKGKALGVPVYELLGGRCRAGAALHAFVERGSAEETAERVAELAAEGWRWFKTKIGFGVDADLAWWRSLRAAVDPELRFQLDGNTGYTLGQALQALGFMEELGGVGLFEQPVRYLGEMATLATRLRTPLQADEALTGPRSVYEIARAGAAQVLHFKIHKYGGLLRAKRMAAVAEAAGLELSVAPYFDVMAAAAAHLAATVPVASWPAGFSDMRDTMLAEPYEPAGQVLEPPPGPGLGVTVDDEKLEAAARG